MFYETILILGCLEITILKQSSLLLCIYKTCELYVIIMEDSYRNGKLREEAVMMTDEDVTPDYRCGYGHGYHRFVTILGQLARYRDLSKEEYYTVMPESAALVILRSVVQNPYTNAAGVSMTQYSAIYNDHRMAKSIEDSIDFAAKRQFGSE